MQTEALRALSRLNPELLPRGRRSQSEAREISMATETSESHGFLYFIVGALIVGVVVLGFLFYNGNLGGRASNDSAVERSADAIGDAADEIGDAARRTTPDGG
jgi:hypothetical protein